MSLAHQTGEPTVTLNQEGVDAFLTELATSVNRRIESVFVLPLHGSFNELSNVQDAIDFVTSYTETTGSHPFVKYEIIVRYNTGAEINGKFPNKKEALSFLITFT